MKNSATCSHNNQTRSFFVVVDNVSPEMSPENVVVCMVWTKAADATSDQPGRVSTLMLMRVGDVTASDGIGVFCSCLTLPPAGLSGPLSATGVETIAYTWATAAARKATPAPAKSPTRWGLSIATTMSSLLSWALSTTRQTGSSSGKRWQNKAHPLEWGVSSMQLLCLRMQLRRQDMGIPLQHCDR